jgi:hypothetical protein
MDRRYLKIVNNFACMEHLNRVFYRYNIIEAGKTVADEEFIY